VKIVSIKKIEEKIDKLEGYFGFKYLLVFEKVDMPKLKADFKHLRESIRKIISEDDNAE
jgi:hypothetical protein